MENTYTELNGLFLVSDHAQPEIREFSICLYIDSRKKYRGTREHLKYSHLKIMNLFKFSFSSKWVFLISADRYNWYCAWCVCEYCLESREEHAIISESPCGAQVSKHCLARLLGSDLVNTHHLSADKQLSFVMFQLNSGLFTNILSKYCKYSNCSDSAKKSSKLKLQQKGSYPPFSCELRSFRKKCQRPKICLSLTNKQTQNEPKNLQ